MIGRPPKNIFSKAKDRLKKYLNSLTLQERVEGCRHFLEKQMQKELKNMMTVIEDQEVIIQAHRIIEYFKEHNIYVKEILYDKDLIIKSDYCISFIGEHPARVKEILSDQLRLKKTFAVIKFFKEETKDLIDDISVISYVINDSNLEYIYKQVSESQKKNETGKQIEMTNRRKHSYVDLSFEESKFDSFSIDETTFQ